MRTSIQTQTKVRTVQWSLWSPTKGPWDPRGPSLPDKPESPCNTQHRSLLRTKKQAKPLLTCGEHNFIVWRRKVETYNYNKNMKPFSFMFSSQNISKWSAYHIPLMYWIFECVHLWPKIILNAFPKTYFTSPILRCIWQNRHYKTVYLEMYRLVAKTLRGKTHQRWKISNIPQTKRFCCFTYIKRKIYVAYKTIFKS